MQIVEPYLLIADDDRDFRESLAEVLQRRGYKIILAEDGECALRIVQEQSIHLMMLDVHMPKLSGLETLASLRRLPLSLPCILMSARLDSTIVDRARSLDLASILSKPFSAATITQTIQKTLFDSYGWHN